MFDDYSTVDVMKQWRVCLVSQSISTEKRQRLLNATEYKRELMHMLSADTMIAEDGLYICTQFHIHGAYTQSFFHMGALGADAIDAALLDKHDVMMSFTRIKQIDIKSDTAIFGDIRVYWAVVILSTPLIGLEQVCYLSALLLLGIEW